MPGGEYFTRQEGWERFGFHFRPFRPLRTKSRTGFSEKNEKVTGLLWDALPADLAAVICYPQDATHETDCLALVRQLINTGEKLNAVIMTGREMRRTSIVEGPGEAFDHVMARNTKTAFLLAKHLGAMMTETGKGAIIFVGSIHDEKPTGATFAFNCSMGALKMLNRECALQLGRKGVHSFLIELGPMQGDEIVMATTLSPIYDNFVYSIPRGCACSFDELADLVDFAIKTPMINGAEIRADAGFMLKYDDR